jgi:hypothetical protein
MVQSLLSRKVHAHSDAERERERGHSGEVEHLQQLAEGEFEVGHGFAIFDLRVAIGGAAAILALL